MIAPRLFDIEGPWDSLDLDWDFIHARTLAGSIQSQFELYKKIFQFVYPHIRASMLAFSNHF